MAVGLWDKQVEGRVMEWHDWSVSDTSYHLGYLEVLKSSIMPGWQYHHVNSTHDCKVVRTVK